jgi:hypothetical protein
MRTSLLERSDASSLPFDIPSDTKGHFVEPAHYRDLLISHRRMERLSCPERHLRGLRDLDTGEVFLIEERRLFGARH